MVSDDTQARLAVRVTLLVRTILLVTLPAKQKASGPLSASSVLVPRVAPRGMITRLVFRCPLTSATLAPRPTASTALLKNASVRTAMMVSSVLAWNGPCPRPLTGRLCNVTRDGMTSFHAVHSVAVTSEVGA